jgi:hypothetical protein
MTQSINIKNTTFYHNKPLPKFSPIKNPTKPPWESTISKTLKSTSTACTNFKPLSARGSQSNLPIWPNLNPHQIMPKIIRITLRRPNKFCSVAFSPSKILPNKSRITNSKSQKSLRKRKKMEEIIWKRKQSCFTREGKLWEKLLPKSQFRINKLWFLMRMCKKKREKWQK